MEGECSQITVVTVIILRMLFEYRVHTVLTVDTTIKRSDDKELLKCAVWCKTL